MQTDVDRRLSELLKSAQDGDPQAYETFLFEAAALVRAYVRRRLRGGDHVEDVVQETLLSIHRDRHTYDPARPVRPWVYAIARNRTFDFIRKNRRQQENEVLVEEGVDALSVEAEDDGGLVASLRQALGLLSITQRSVIRMLKLEGYSVAEISQQTGLSESSVKVTAHRGYQKLRKLIARPIHE